MKALVQSKNMRKWVYKGTSKSKFGYYSTELGRVSTYNIAAFLARLRIILRRSDV